MQIRELSAEQCLELLKRSTLGHLGCVLDRQPYVVPIHFSLDAERNCLYGFSSVGQKIAWMRENPHVCVEVPEITDRNHWTTVLIFGRYEEIDDTPEHADARQRMLDLLQERREWWLPATAKLGSQERAAVLIYQIHIDRMTGRSAARDR